MNTAFLNPARHLKAKIRRYWPGRRRERIVPVNFQPRNVSSLERDVAYAIQIANGYLAQLARAQFRLPEKSILELGPGSDFGASLILASHGARVAVADRFLAPWDNQYHPEFYRLLRSRYDGPTSAIDTVLVAGGYPEAAINRIPKSAEQMRSLPCDTFDCVLSNAVLEHVGDMRKVARCLARITKAGGYNLHQIDFRDHRDFSRPLEFLLLSDREHRKMFKERNGECGNRVRLSEAVKVFQEAGLPTHAVENESLAPDAYLSEFIPRLRSSRSMYRDWQSDDLRVISARLVLRKHASL